MRMPMPTLMPCDHRIGLHIAEMVRKRDAMPEIEYYDGFRWAVPTSFCEPLANCKFEEGDILYDNKIAYEAETWAEALPYLQYSLQVSYPPRGLYGDVSSNDSQIDMTDDTPNVSSSKTATQFERNWYSKVVLQFTDYNERKSRQVITTQGKLYSLLWKDDMQCLSGDIAHPPVPSLMPSPIKKADLNYLKQANDYLTNTIIQYGTSTMFLMPYDLTNPVMRNKLTKVQAMIHSLKPQISFCLPEESGVIVTPAFVPTARLVCISIKSAPREEIHERLKEALYTPTKGSNVDRFKIERHGYLR